MLNWQIFVSTHTLTGLEVWRQGWRQFFLVRVQATVTFPPEQFIYIYFYQIVVGGSVRLNGAGVIMKECTPEVSGWIPDAAFWSVFHEALFLRIYALFS